MKKILIFFIFSLMQSNQFYGQLLDGATVPDFTFTDINGTTQNLYTYLDSGKYVAIDVSATWCVPCWEYHSSGVNDSLYTLHDIPGDQTWKVLFIEGDGNTTLADLQGTGTNTQGDWLSGTPYPTMNPSGILLNDFLSAYNINFFPTLFIICPNKKIYQDTLNTGSKPFVIEWEYASSLCGPSGLDDLKDENPLTIFPNPAIDFAVLYFSLNHAVELKLTVENAIGQILDNKDFGILPSGDQSLKFDVSSYKAGIYFFTLSEGNKRFVRKKVIVN